MRQQLSLNANVHAVITQHAKILMPHFGPHATLYLTAKIIEVENL